MGQRLFEDRIGTLSESSGIITLQPSVLTIGGQQYSTNALTAFTIADVLLKLYYIYAVESSGVVSLIVSENVNSVGPAGQTVWKLVGAYYVGARGDDLSGTLRFGSFVNIEGVPESEQFQVGLTNLTTSNAPFPNYTGFVTNSVMEFQRKGDSAQFRGFFRKNAGGSNGTQAHEVPIPGGLTKDPDKLSELQNNPNDYFGSGQIIGTGTTTHMGVQGITSIFRFSNNNTGATIKSSTHSFTGLSSLSFFTYFLPYSELSNTPLKDL